MGNSVIHLLETFFPKNIDMLLKEDSDLDGMKPVILQGGH
jgi:hypothetical protein